METEKFCLRWNDFESNISSAFRELRDEKDFFDVTLACDDEQIQSHKMILSACSPFFRNVLRRNPHQHPLIYLKGVKYTDLQSVLNFMYHGEVNIAQEELNSFLSVAEDLKVKGLTQNTTESQKQKTVNKTLPKSSIQQTKPQINRQHQTKLFAKPLSTTPKQSGPNACSAEFSSSTHAMNDDIQEIVSVKTEQKDLPLPHVGVKDIFMADSSQTLAHVEDDGYGYMEDHEVEFEESEDGQDYAAAVVEGMASYEATDGNKG